MSVAPAESGQASEALTPAVNRECNAVVLDEYTLENLTGNEWRGPGPPLCPSCGYNLTGLPEPRCPECGSWFSWSQIQRHSRRVFYDQARLKFADQDAAAGLRFVLAAWVGLPLAWGLRVYVHLFLGTMVFLMAVGMGFTALVLGCQVFRVLRLPPAAREQLANPPNQWLGLAVVALAFALLAAATTFV